MLQINTNVAALTAHRTLSRTADTQAGSIERLSTGYRINRASDDPSGLVISEKLRSQISGLRQALENTQNDINLVNTAEAALQEISDILVDMRSSIIFAMNSGFSIPEQIAAEQDKIDQSLVAIDRIAASTRFAKRSLLNGASDFIIEQSATDRGAVDELQVRQVRLAPSAETQTFSVNVTKLAERAMLITNKTFNSADYIASLSPGGNAGDVVTLRITGNRGAEDVNFGATATVQDMISAINQVASSTGVYASSYQALPVNSTFHEAVIPNSTGGISLNSFGTSANLGVGIVFGVSIDGGPVQNVLVTDDDGDGNLMNGGVNGRLADALQALDSGFTVDTDAAGNVRINHNTKSFTVGGAANVKVLSFSAAELAASLVEDTGNGDLDFAFDLNGDGATDGTVSMTALGAGVTFDPSSAAHRTAMLNALDTFFGATPNIAYHFDANNNLVLVDTDGTSFNTAGNSPIGILSGGASDTTVSALLKNAVNTANYTADLSQVMGVPVAGIKAQNRPVQYINFDVNPAYVNAQGQLAIDPAFFGGTVDITITDPDDSTDTITLAINDANGNNVIDIDDINAALAGQVNGGAFAMGNTNFEGANIEAYFSKEYGLTFVYNNAQVNPADKDPTFTLAGPDAVLLTGRTQLTSVSNINRLALYSLDFGSDQVMSIEDVTSSASTASIRSNSNSNGGIMVTGAGRDGLGVFDGDSATLVDLNGSRITGTGKDAAGTINGTSFSAKGWNVQLVTTALDVKMRLAESWGQFGRIGQTADLVRFGANYSFGGVKAQPHLFGGPMIDNVLDTFQFKVRQNYANGPRGTSGLRFQIRESASAADSLTIGIRSINTTDLGIDIDSESSDMTSAQRMNSLAGGRLSSMRTGAGNDLFQNPENALKILDASLDQVNGLRAFLGSISRDTLQRSLNSSTVALENLVSSEGEIRDIDFAAETTEFARQQVLYAAGTSVLASANQVPQTLLQLLR